MTEYEALWLPISKCVALEDKIVRGPSPTSGSIAKSGLRRSQAEDRFSGFEFFCEISYSHIDNARLNFTLGLPQKFFGLKNSGPVLENRYAIN